MTFVSVILAALGFIVLVILHELGHFTVAKLVGMRVEKFSLFFPPTIFSRTRGETEYAIGAIPAGGYVKITGMNPDEDLPEEVRDRAYHAQKPWKRIVVILAGPAVNVLVALILFFVYCGRDRAIRTSTDRVTAIEKGSPAAQTLQARRPPDLRGRRERRPGRRCRSRSATHQCAGAQRDGCRAAEPARMVVSSATASRSPDQPCARSTTASNKRPRLGFRFAAGPREPLPIGEAARASASTSSGT